MRRSMAVKAAVAAIFFLPIVLSQQPYLDNKQMDCYNSYTSAATSGYLCPAAAATNASRSCTSYLTFRSSPPYANLVTVSFLLNASTPISALSSLNNFSDVEPIPADTLLFVPVPCSCSGPYFQHNASYTITPTDTYFIVANDTYQGLTTCQALIEQNPYPSRELKKGDRLNVPLRCACPSANQTARGIRYLVNYLARQHDEVSKVAAMFGVSEASVLDANELGSESTIFPFNPLLIPLTHEPKTIDVSPPPPPPPPPQPPAPSTQSGRHKNWPPFVGGGVGGAVLIVAGILVLICFKKRTKGSEVPGSAPVKKLSAKEPVLAAALSKEQWMIDDVGLKDAIETLTKYSIEDLEDATGFFSEESRIKGCVYHGKFKGDSAAIKVLKGDDESSEINILSQMNHGNIIRLSGFCVHEGSAYLVYEYADNGSLRDWLRKKDSTSALSWKQRVQIAYGTADALDYLHNYTNPPHVHKNLNSSNILLDGNFRAKVANFGLARSMEDTGEGELRLTRHVVGAHGYLAPEYVENGVITTKMDVFSFGVIMLELLSGREAVGDGKNREEMLCVAINAVLDGDNVREKLNSFIDPSLEKKYPLDLAYLVAELAKKCVAANANARPAIPEVLVTLSRIFSSSEEWDPSDTLNNSHTMSIGG